MKKFVFFSLISMFFCNFANAASDRTPPVPSITGSGTCERIFDADISKKRNVYIIDEGLLFKENDEGDVYIGENFIHDTLATVGLKPTDYKVEIINYDREDNFLNVAIESLDNRQYLIDLAMHKIGDTSRSTRGMDKITARLEDNELEEYKDCYIKALTLAKEDILKTKEILGVRKIKYNNITSDSNIDWKNKKQTIYVRLKYDVVDD